jgi:hypothetical protein
MRLSAHRREGRPDAASAARLISSRYASCGARLLLRSPQETSRAATTAAGPGDGSSASWIGLNLPDTGSLYGWLRDQ